MRGVCLGRERRCREGRRRRVKKSGSHTPTVGLVGSGPCTKGGLIQPRGVCACIECMGIQQCRPLAMSAYADRLLAMFIHPSQPEQLSMHWVSQRVDGCMHMRPCLCRPAVSSSCHYLPHSLVDAYNLSSLKSLPPGQTWTRRTWQPEPPACLSAVHTHCLLLAATAGCPS